VTGERKIFWGALSAAALVVGALVFWPEVEESLRPRPRRAWVAVEVAGAGVAEVGRVEVAAGTPFTLHAVLEAAGRGGEPVYYTAAERLRIGGEEVAGAAIRPWEGSDPQILWFTVEGFTPFLEVQSAADLERFRFEEVLQPDWPRAWAVPGSLEASRQGGAPADAALPYPPFGTQRYQVRIEFYGEGSEVRPQARFLSPGAESLPESWREFPTVVATLPPPLAVPSRVIRLTQLEAAPGASPGVRETIAEWTRRELAFSQDLVLAAMLAERGASPAALAWRRIEIAANPAWGPAGVEAGDLLRVGERVVVLHRDRGLAGRLDYEDTCFDFERSALVRSLGQVFSGGGLVEWAPLPEAGAPARTTGGGAT
jgi:hypothetical protein